MLVLLAPPRVAFPLKASVISLSIEACHALIVLAAKINWDTSIVADMRKVNRYTENAGDSCKLRSPRHVRNADAVNAFSLSGKV